MKLSEYVISYKSKINEVIGTFLDKKINENNASFLKTYYEGLKSYILAGGKRIRPLLSIATYNAFNTKKDDRIITPSVGIEFLHNASLIHDDIIDKDNFRRGNPAFHYMFQKYHDNYVLKKMNSTDFGNSIGIIGGDSTFFLGLEPFLFNQFDLDLNSRAIKYYEQVFHNIANGVLMETDMVNLKVPSVEDYILMVSLKTGALLEKSILIGANYAKVGQEHEKYLSKYGINLGIIFQIIDDILGTFGNEKTTGKPIDGDIREGKRTLLLIKALEALDKEDKAKLSESIKKIKITTEDVIKIRELFIKANAVESCKALASFYYEEAKIAIDKLELVINDSEKEFFNDLLDFVYSRNF